MHERLLMARGIGSRVQNDDCVGFIHDYSVIVSHVVSILLDGQRVKGEQMASVGSSLRKCLLMAVLMFRFFDICRGGECRESEFKKGIV